MSEAGAEAERREQRLVEIGMEVVRGILDEHERKAKVEEISKRSDKLLAYRMTGSRFVGPEFDYETELLQAGENDIPFLVADGLVLRERVGELEEALERVSAQVPDAIGGEPYLISCGALYAVRNALATNNTQENLEYRYYAEQDEAKEEQMKTIEDTPTAEIRESLKHHREAAGRFISGEQPVRDVGRHQEVAGLLEGLLAERTRREELEGALREYKRLAGAAADLVEKIRDGKHIDFAAERLAKKLEKAGYLDED